MFDFSNCGSDFLLLTKFVAEACCIHLGEDKKYLFESRLGSVISESGATTIPEFIRLANADATGKLRDRVIDVMTTHETYWFRDSHPWAAMENQLLPNLASKLASGERSRIRILCAACSTGQEPYSIALLLQKLSGAGKLCGARPENFEILAFDVSRGTLFLAAAGRYSQIEIARGLPPFWRDNYFDPTPGNTWTLRESVRRMVTFKRRNLQDSFAGLGFFDLVLCRNVAIYFQEDFKRELFNRISGIICPGGHLMLGGSESLLSHNHLFEIDQLENAIFYKRRDKPPGQN
jgi:chemotaxis protein methyltransferase CheR